MIDSLTAKKAKFPSTEKQALWMLKVCTKVSTGRMALICSCSERTIRGWKMGKTMMPYKSLLLLAKEADVLVPKIQQIDRYEHTRRAGLTGSSVVMKKYGRVPVNENVRKENWRKWFDNGGKNEISDFFIKNICVPERNEKLAEFIGIMLGDGGMTQYQVSVTLHSIDDLEYGLFVKSLVQKLFGVMPSVYVRKDAHAHSIVLARKRAVTFLVSLGLVTGNKVKQQINIPTWILENEEYSLACLRGLMDTDGSVYLHKYKVGGKEYQYKKLCFSSASVPLQNDVLFILHRFGSTATCSGTNVRIDAVCDVTRYMKVIGTHNPKHLKRYLK